MELCLHQVRGRAARLSVTLRQCTREEAEAVYRLQNEVRAMMPNPELFMPDTLENIQSYLEHDLCLGAWDGERLGAYFILRYCGHSEHNYAAFMGIPEAEWEHCANADSVIPGNPYSLNNAKASGFEIVSRREMYGGHDRYLLAKHL